jgi:Tfp pilus assembly protein PilF
VPLLSRMPLPCRSELGGTARSRNHGTTGLVSRADPVEIFRDIRNRQGEAAAVYDLGRTRQATGNYHQASSAFRQALRLARSLGDQGGEVEVLNEIGALCCAQGKLRQATAFHCKAQNLAQEIGSLWDEAQALAGLGRCSMAAGDTEDAIVTLRQALEIFTGLRAAEAKEVERDLRSLQSTSGHDVDQASER